MKGKDKHFELAGARVIDTRDQLYFQFAYFSALQCPFVEPVKSRISFSVFTEHTTRRANEMVSEWGNKS